MILICGAVPAHSLRDALQISYNSFKHSKTPDDFPSGVLLPFALQKDIRPGSKLDESIHFPGAALILMVEHLTVHGQPEI